MDGTNQNTHTWNTIHIPTEYFFNDKKRERLKLNGAFSFEMIDPQKGIKYFLMQIKEIEREKKIEKNNFDPIMEYICSGFTIIDSGKSCGINVNESGQICVREFLFLCVLARTNERERERD